ncbi:MAG: hypothetical protein MJE66_06955 [Proteobacteria bacterium]|nr:hypothetical protein [Pseudomonadota bacterium]
MKVKGLVLDMTLEPIRQALERGDLAENSLDMSLSPEALALFREKIEPARWYPAEPYAALAALAWELSGDDAVATARDVGSGLVQLLRDSANYQQLELRTPVDEIQSTRQALSQARLITSMVNTFFDFIQTECAIEEGSDPALVVTYDNAALFSEMARYCTEGFMVQVLREMGNPDATATSERPNPDRVVFRMRLARSETG